MAKKMDGIDYFQIELNKRNGLIHSEIDTYKNEIERLKRRQNVIERVDSYLKKEILPMVVKTLGNNEGVYETDTSRYKLYETYGPVNVDMEKASASYVKIKMTETIDKVRARKDAIAADKAGQTLEGITINKVERVKRS
tara:strand:- start:1840 stop:2256 length:417 start_codon:yes stop_codon:yes gene_type:complete